MRGLDDVEDSMARLARQLDPARQDVSSFNWVRSASKARRLASPILPTSLIGMEPLTAGPRSNPMTGAARVIERRLQFDIGIAFVRLAIVQRGRLPVDLHVALDLIAGIIGDNLQRVGFELLIMTMRSAANPPRSAVTV